MSIKWEEGTVCYFNGVQWRASDNPDILIYTRHNKGRSLGIMDGLGFKDFKLNEPKEGHYIPKSELDTEEKYNQAVEVLGLFGYEEYRKNGGFEGLERGGYLALGVHFNNVINLRVESNCRVKLTYPQLMAIGEIKRKMDGFEIPNTAIDGNLLLIDYEGVSLAEEVSDQKEIEAYRVLSSMGIKYDTEEQKWFKKERIMSIKIKKGHHFVFQATKTLPMIDNEIPFIIGGKRYVGTFTGSRDFFVFRSECEDEHLFSLSDEDFISSCKFITPFEEKQVDKGIIDKGECYKEHSKNLVRLTNFLYTNKLGKLGHDVVDEAIRLITDTYLIKNDVESSNSSELGASAPKKTKTLAGLNIKTCPTFTAEIYMAGDYTIAKNIAREYCLDGFCVSFEEVDYIYTMGGESGFVCRIINYPRFPRSATEIKEKATELAEKLINELHQGSCSIVYSDETVFLTRREGDV